MFKKIKKGSAVHGGTPKTSLWASSSPRTVKEIQGAVAAKKMTSGLDAILLPDSRDNWQLPQLKMITPDYIERTLEGALNGDSPADEQALYNLMAQTWPKLTTNVMQLKNAVADMVWNVVDPEDNDYRTHLAKRCRDGMKGNFIESGYGWRDTIKAIMDGWFLGVSVLEIDWELRGCTHFPQSVLPRQTRKVSPKFYGWDMESGKFGMRKPGEENLGEIAPNKFLICGNNTSFGHPSGGALLRPLAWFWCASNFSSEWLLNFAQLFGQPIRWATYDSNNVQLRDTIMQMLESMGSAAYAAMPSGTNLEFKEPSNKGADNPQTQLMNLANTACDLLILGQTLTSSPGEAGSRALGEVHYQVRADIINSAAQWVAEIINEQMITSAMVLNLGDVGEDAVLPYLEATIKKASDPKANADMIKVLLDAGVKLKKSEVHEMTGTTLPEGDDEVYTGSAQGMVSPMGMMAKAMERMPSSAKDYYLAKMAEVQDDR